MALASLWLALGSAALTAGLALWILGMPWLRPVAEEGTSGEHTPFWWAWVCALESVVGRLVTWRGRRRFTSLQARAGLHPRWHAGHWVAARLLAALVAAFALAVGGLAVQASSAWLLAAALLGGVAGACWPAAWLQRRVARQRLAMMRELPFMLDLLTLCVEAGLSLPAALHQVAAHAPAGALRRTLEEAAALERTGMSRARWLARWAQMADVPGVHNLVLTLAQADRLGMSLGPLLRAQAAQQRSERFLRAERLALEAPVRMLFPMVLCIFPCTFLVIGWPVAVRLLDSGL